MKEKYLWIIFGGVLILLSMNNFNKNELFSVVNSLPYIDEFSNYADGSDGSPNWIKLSGNQAKIINQKMKLENSKYLLDSINLNSYIYYAEFKMASGTALGAFAVNASGGITQQISSVKAGEIDFYFNYQDSEHYYSLNFYPDEDKIKLFLFKTTAIPNSQIGAVVVNASGSVISNVTTITYTILKEKILIEKKDIILDLGKNYNTKIDTKNNKLNIYFDNNLILGDIPLELQIGKVGFGSINLIGLFDNVIISDKETFAIGGGGGGQIIDLRKKAPLNYTASKIEKEEEKFGFLFYLILILAVISVIYYFSKDGK